MQRNGTGIHCNALMHGLPYLSLAATSFFLIVALHAAGARREVEPVLTELPTARMASFSTVPPNGDVNPYGVAFVPMDFAAGGPLHPGDILVSNFNNLKNLQGTGTTIVQVTPRGHVSVFFQGGPGLGLTTALGALRQGFVLVGNVPTTDGTSTTVGQGSLLILDRFGHQVANLASGKLLDGPWDLAIRDAGDEAQVFVSNVLSGTVTRLDLDVPRWGNRIRVRNATQIVSGYVHRPDPSALVVGPTGLAYDAEQDTLYVASTGDNAIYAIPRAGATGRDGGTGRVVYRDDVHLHGPLALLLAPNGDLITANGDAVNPDANHPSELVEFTPEGHFVAQFSVDPTGPGGAFGIALKSSEEGFLFAAVDDILNTLDIWTIPEENRGR